MRSTRSVDLVILDIFIGSICRCGCDRIRHTMCARRRNRTSQALRIRNCMWSRLSNFIVINVHVRAPVSIFAGLSVLLTVSIRASMSVFALYD